MQLPRVIIAAAFFVIGALIAIPALTRTASSSPESSAPALSETQTPSPTPTVTTTAKTAKTATATPSKTPDPAEDRHTGTPTPSRAALASPSPTSQAPQLSRSHTPTATPVTTPPTKPLKVTIGTVTCPERTVSVTVANESGRTEDYAIEEDGSATIADRISPKTTRTTKITLREDRSTVVAVTWRNMPVKSAKRTADCNKPIQQPEELPHTGPQDATLQARITTGIAAMVTGAIIFWYGGIWPRRRDPMLLKEDNGRSENNED